MATYSEVGDLLNGNIPLPDYVDKQKFVQDAADEIDSKIGFIYVTPIDISDSSDVPRPARLLLKRINNFLATGRLLMAVDAGGEDDRLHAYGWSLVQEATVALSQIASGEIYLKGADPVNVGEDAIITSIIVNNLDVESNVEAFYDRVMNPAYFFGYSEAESINTHGLGVVR
jgi:hypothetical protein